MTGEEQDERPRWSEALPWVLVLVVSFVFTVRAAIWSPLWLAWVMVAVSVLLAVAVWAVVRACLGRNNVIATGLRGGVGRLSAYIIDESAVARGERAICRWPRPLFAAVACAAVSVAVMLARHTLRPDPLIGWNMIVIPFVAALFGAFTVFFANARRAKRWVRLGLLPFMVGLLLAAVIADTPLPLEWSPFGSQVAVEQITVELAADLVREMGDAETASRLSRSLYVAPVLLFGTCVLVAAMTAFNVGLGPDADPRRRLLAYPACVGVIALFRLLIPPLVLLTWPSVWTLSLAFGDARWWVLVLMAVSADGGQSFGGSGFLGRHTRAVVATLGVVAALALVVFWRPMLAEYSYMRGIALACRRGPDSEREGAAKALTRAYRLRPDNEKYAHAYAHEVLFGRAFKLMDREEYDEALEVLGDMRQVLPRSPSPYQMLGVVHARQGRIGKAAADYRNAITASRRLTAEDYRRWGTLGFPTAACEKRLLDCLGRLGDEESVQEILALLLHEDGDVAVHAVGVLAEHGITQAVEPLRELVRSHSEEKVREAASRALSELTHGDYGNDPGLR